MMWWGQADTPAPSAALTQGKPAALTVAVAPPQPGHAVSVDWRLDGGAVQRCQALALPRAPQGGPRLFRALLPSDRCGRVDYLPVLTVAGQPVSPRLADGANAPSYRVSAPAAPQPDPKPVLATAAGQPRWAWTPVFLGGVTATVRKELVGATADGLRINWHVVNGHFVGPGLDAVVLPGATDWMSIRADGVGLVSVQACFETREGVRIYGSYGGRFDLGPDGYARALRDEFDPLPPVVVTPTYATADKALAWLNRVQCMGVGRVDMAAQRVEFDVYRLDIAGRLTGASD